MALPVATVLVAGASNGKGTTMYRCYFCGGCSEPRQAQLKHTRYKQIPVTPKVKTIVFEDDHGRMRRRSVPSSELRTGKAPASEVAVCRECYGSLLTLSESELRMMLKLRGTSTRSKKIVGHEGPSMFFGGTSPSNNEVPLEALPTTAVTFG